MIELLKNLKLISIAFAQDPGVTTDFNPTGPKIHNVGEYLNLIMPWFTIILGSVAFLVFIIAGYIYMTSQGDQTKIGLAKELIIGVITGILLLFLINVLKQQIGF